MSFANGLPVYAGHIRAKTVSNLTGKTWCIVKAEFSDWTAVDADTTNLFSFFGSKLDGQTPAQINNFLKTTTVSVLTTQQKTNALNKLTSLGVDTTGIDNSTTLFEVLRRVLTTMYPNADMDAF